MSGAEVAGLAAGGRRARGGQGGERGRAAAAAPERHGEGAAGAGLAADARRPRVTEVEQHGIATIPDAERASRPFDLFRIQFGGANTFATVILGTFPVLLGLSLVEAVLATLTGVVGGALVLMPRGLFGPRAGTKQACP